MNSTVRRILGNIILGLQVLLIYLLFFEKSISLPPWLQVAGRLHPLILHLPIGFFIFILVLIIFRKYLGPEPLSKLLEIGLLITALAASLTALFGFFLSLQGDYGSENLWWHKMAGVLLSIVCYVIASWDVLYIRRYYLFGGLALTFTILIVAGHTGAVLTHGQNFVLAPVTKPPVLTAENASVYDFAVKPILEKKCFSCHNETKAKGGLVMTSLEKFRAGGENGKPWVEGRPADSRIVKSFHLPLDHDEHMPPKGKPQLTKFEIATIESWIASGADFNKTLDQLAENDSLKFILASFAEKRASITTAKSYYFDAAPENTVNKLNTPFRSVFPLHVGSPALQADFFLRANFQVNLLEELKSVAQQIVVINLSMMPVRDKDLKILEQFPNLEVLNLNFTDIDGTGLNSLAVLKKLESISLAGTSVDGSHLTQILELPKLRSLYLWNTNVSPGEINALNRRYPSVTIIGDLYSEETTLKLGKPRIANEPLIKKGEPVILKHSMPGVKVLVTTDASEPDSTSTKVYTEPFTLDETAVVKARACKEGWYCSDLFETTCFVQGVTPKSVALLEKPDKEYPGKGASSLTDLQKGFVDILKEPSWLGYRETPFAATFEFDHSTSLSKIVVSYGRNIGGYVFPPQEVEVWAGNTPENWSLIKKIKPEQPKEYVPNGVMALAIPLNAPVTYSNYKIIAKPVTRLPAWHGGKGDRGWFFIDEIFFY